MACVPAAPLRPASVGLSLAAEGLASPVALVDPGDASGRLFIADQTGLIWILGPEGRLPEPFLDLRARLVALSAFYDERGLLGLAFHPDFAANGRFYVYYSGPRRAGLPADEWDHTTYISEFEVSGTDPDRADPSSERILLSIDKPGYNYEAGQLAFGPDGYLYIATGDSVHDPASEAGKYAQDTYSLLGKILRVDVNVPAGYAIPPDNPFANGGGRPEVFAYGFRNPYRFSFGDGRMFVADVGQAVMEEVSLVRAGGNYGWPIREGTTCFNPDDWAEPLESCAQDGLFDPTLAYRHTQVLSAIIGGMEYRGRALPALQGGYVFGDWGRGDGQLFLANIIGTHKVYWRVTQILVELPEGMTGLGQLLGIGEDAEGELYLLVKDPGMGPQGDSGRVYKLVPP
jgi:glucose/arabinose dehydrogenase